MCACGSEIETTKHFLFRCHLCFPQRPELFENLKKIGSSFLNLNVKDKILYDSQSTTSNGFNHDIKNTLKLH